MRQRAALASILYFDPMLILLDEPTTGLDPDGIILTRTLFNEAKARGAAIIVTGHHLSEIDKVVDEFIILKNGKMLFHGPIESARKYRDLEEFYLAINKE
jgi:ABC-type multidrug transport system ATPase subunit